MPSFISCTGNGYSYEYKNTQGHIEKGLETMLQALFHIL